MKAPTSDSRVSEILHAGSFASVWLAGLVASITMRYLGPPLAMGAQMWVAMNTEPVTPHLDFPVVPVALAAVLPVPLLMNRKWNHAFFASLPFLFVPWWYFFRLYDLARGSPG